MNETPSSPETPPPLLGSFVPQKPRWRWGIHLLLIAAYPLLIGALGWRSRGSAAGPVLSTSAAGLLLASAFELVFFGLFFGGAWLASRASRDDLLLRWRGGFWTVPVGLGYSVLLRLALGIVVTFAGAVLVAARVLTPDSLQHFFSANRPDVGAIVDIPALRENPVYFWLMVSFVSFILGGLREELWRSGFLGGMRVLWPDRFGSRAGQIAAAAIAAVIFGFGHLTQGWFAVGLAALLGFGLGVIIVLHRSIWPAVFTHGMFDATSLALLPWVMQQMQHAGKSFGG